ncbi:MAG: formylmethanofuran dehydrogenase subunit C [Thermoproteota archaeon]
MTSVILRIKKKLTVPVDASAILPENFYGKSGKQIEELQLWEGNVLTRLGEIFDLEEISDEGTECTIKIKGDAAKLRMVGKGMSSGTINIDGNAGIRLGEAMRGGIINVMGDADSWLGARMKGGRIEVSGNAGDYVGSALRGSRWGMRGGEIVVHGNAGDEIGCWMRNGLIRIGGNVGQFAGIHMLDGTILIEGDAEGRVGAAMKGGRIVVLGEVGNILPSFSIEEIRKVVRVGGESFLGPFYVFAGDLVEDGDGRLYVSKDRNPSLQFYESYID